MNKRLISVLIIAAALRLVVLGQYPVHLTNDEAALGYNAYSILKTARDEHGQLLPVIFKSFGDWKPGLYIYMTIPFIATLNLSEFAVRLPSALAGVVAVYLVFKIVEFFYGNKNIALLASLLLAITPWHIHFSRGAWEANLALSFLLAGLWFFLKSFERSKFLYLSSIFFALSLWAYQSAKLASFLVLLGLSIVFIRKILKIQKKDLAVSVIIGVALSIPIFLSLGGEKGGRLEVMSVFSYTRPAKYIEETVFKQDNINSLNLTYYLFHSESYNLMRGVMGRYFNHLSARFLFFEGDWQNPIHTSPDVGYLLYAEIPFLIYCMFY